MANSTFDVLIVGGGPAGLSAALGLARQFYSVVVFDSEDFRKEPHARMHNFLTWDHRSPQQFRETAKKEILARYSTVLFKNTTVESVKKDANGFELVDKHQNKYYGKKVVLAHGVKTIMPSIDGYSDCWDKTIFPCLFCDGYEQSGGASAGLLAEGMLANPAMAIHMAFMAGRLAKSITIYTNGEDTVTTQIKDSIDPTQSFTLEGRKIARLEREPDNSAIHVHFEDGTSKRESFLTHLPPTKIDSPFVQQLGLTLTQEGFIQTTPPFHETTVYGVFAIGDCGSMFKTVSQAVAMGSFAATGAAIQLCAGH